MEVATEVGARSIAFPGVSTGVYGFPVERAARIAVDAIRSELDRPDRPVEVVLCAFSAAAADVLRAALDSPAQPPSAGEG